MNSENDKEFVVGRGGKAKLNNLKDEPKSKHYDTASYKEMKKAGNTHTVGNEQTIKNDISKIKNGEAKRTTTKVKGNLTTRFTLNNGRTYRAGALDKNGQVTLYPEKGSGLTQLNKKESRALGILNDYGIGSKSRTAMKTKGISGNDADKALKVWQKNKGKNLNPRNIKGWQSQYNKTTPRQSQNKPKRIK